jgi:hypothetical protein
MATTPLTYSKKKPEQITEETEQDKVGEKEKHVRE